MYAELRQRSLINSRGLLETERRPWKGRGVGEGDQSRPGKYVEVSGVSLVDMRHMSTFTKPHCGATLETRQCTIGPLQARISDGSLSMGQSRRVLLPPS